MTVLRKIELLAPAGGPGTALAAFDAGADAVYIGLNKFNARERTENFSFDDLSRLMAYAGKIGRKVYVTRSEERRVGKESRSRWAAYH